MKLIVRAIICIALLPSTAWASPITIDVWGGGVSNPVTDTGSGAFLDLFGDEFALRVRLQSPGGGFASHMPYTPGEQINIEAGWLGFGAPGSVTFEGISYSVGTLRGGSLSVLFESDDFLIPRINEASEDVIVPFILTGTASLSGAFNPGPTLAFEERGLAMFTFSDPHGPANALEPTVWGSVAADFQLTPSGPQPVPVPEPATILLLGGGVVALCRQRIRERRRGRSHLL